MTTREEFEAWFDKEYAGATNHQLQALVNEMRDVKWIVWQAAYTAALEEAAKECDEMQAMFERQSLMNEADAAEQCAMGIRALKGE